MKRNCKGYNPQKTLIEKEEKEEKRKNYWKKYYERNKLKICKRIVNEYMPKTIRKISMSNSEKVNELYLKYPFEKYADPIIKRKLKYKGIKDYYIEYQECYSIAMEAYIYGIHQCARNGYQHVGAYIRKMIDLSIIWGVIISNESRYICKENHLKLIELDSCERQDFC